MGQPEGQGRSSRSRHPKQVLLGGQGRGCAELVGVCQQAGPAASGCAAGSKYAVGVSTGSVHCINSGDTANMRVCAEDPALGCRQGCAQLRVWELRRAATSVNILLRPTLELVGS